MLDIEAINIYFFKLPPVSKDGQYSIILLCPVFWFLIFSHRSDMFQNYAQPKKEKILTVLHCHRHKPT